jgi:hypothetical protein
VLDQGIARFDGSTDGIVHSVHNPAALESVMDRLRCALATVGHWQTLNFQGFFRWPAVPPPCA